MNIANDREKTIRNNHTSKPNSKGKKIITWTNQITKREKNLIHKKQKKRHRSHIQSALLQGKKAPKEENPIGEPPPSNQNRPYNPFPLPPCPTGIPPPLFAPTSPPTLCMEAPEGRPSQWAPDNYSNTVLCPSRLPCPSTERAIVTAYSDSGQWTMKRNWQFSSLFLSLLYIFL